MIKQPPFKIALVGDMLSMGGAERVQARLSFFFEAQGIDVHHIIVMDRVTYPFAGTLFNMGKLKNKSNGFANKISRFNALKTYLKEQKFDFIIDFRVKNNFIQEYLIANFLYKSKYVMSIRSFETKYYFPKNNYFAKFIYHKAYGLVTVSKALENKIIEKYGYQNVCTIYNPIDRIEIQKHASGISPFDITYILGVGRLTAIKQWDHLIEAFAASNAVSKKIKLVLLGEGHRRDALQLLVKKLNIEKHVVFVDFKENPFPYLKNAYFTALTSKNEGFPNVLLESLACGTPVLAYNCESGPNEIITNLQNGLLVENQNIQAMTLAINKMVENKKLYDICKENSVNSVERFEFETIGNAWLQFLNIPVKS